MVSPANNALLSCVMEDLGCGSEQVILPATEPLSRYFCGDSLIVVRRKLWQQLSVRDKSLAQRFYAGLDESEPVANCFDLSEEYHVPSASELEGLFAIDGEGLMYWPNFRNRYPDSHGVLSLGIPRFSETEDVAILYLGQTSGPLAGCGRLYSFKAQNSNCWTIAGRMGLWIS